MPRRVLVFGSRDFPKPRMVWDVLTRVVRPDDIVMHGACPHPRNAAGRIVGYSVDSLADDWAAERHPIEPDRHPADWDAHGNAAGPIRNTEMAGLLIPGDIWLGFWNGRSTGTMDMLKKAGPRCPGRLYCAHWEPGQ